MADLDLKDMDVRVIEFHRRRGDVTPSNYDSYLDTLEDCAAEALEADVVFTTPWAQRGDKSSSDDA